MKVGLIGNPLSHSYSKVIHETLGEYSYHLFPLPEDDFKNWMELKDFDGINVTIPYKQSVIPYLDEIDTKAKEVGAINTVVNQNGRLKGYNTDVTGFSWLLDFHAIQIKGKRVAILGNGGATKAVLAVLKERQALSIVIVSRRDGMESIKYDDFYKEHKNIQVIINATPVGMSPNIEESLLNLDVFSEVESVIDLIYNPLRTHLILSAQDRGLKVAGGLAMVVAQAKEGIEIFTGKKLEEKKVIMMIHQLIQEKENLVFIGMPGAGKTTISKEVAKKMKKEWISIDEEIVRQKGKSIEEIFKEEHELGFRKIEEEIVLNLKDKEGIVIDCGGGLVKQERVMNVLRHRGKIIWIQRDIACLPIDHTRPLSKSRERLYQLYEERKEKYNKFSDLEIENQGSIEEVVETILALVG